MPKMSGYDKELWSLFIGKGGKRSYNKVCRGCVNRCKQSFRVEIVKCPLFVPKEQ